MNTEATHDKNEALSTGVRLRNAREQLGFSQQAVAERLCLKVSTVRDIEEDKAPADLASTFLRGYIRSYARLVHIPEEELLPGLLSALTQSEDNPNIIEGASSWFDIRAPHEITFNLDGEPLSGQEFHIEILPAALRCRLPPGCPLLR